MAFGVHALILPRAQKTSGPFLTKGYDFRSICCFTSIFPRVAFQVRADGLENVSETNRNRSRSKTMSTVSIRYMIDDVPADNLYDEYLKEINKEGLI
jgi:hypothetical protein